MLYANLKVLFVDDFYENLEGADNVGQLWTESASNAVEVLPLYSTCMTGLPGVVLFSLAKGSRSNTDFEDTDMAGRNGGHIGKFAKKFVPDDDYTFLGPVCLTEKLQFWLSS